MTDLNGSLGSSKFAGAALQVELSKPARLSAASGRASLELGRFDLVLVLNVLQSPGVEDRALQANRNLCMPSHQGNPQALTGLPNLCKNVLHQGGCGRSLW